MLLSGKIDEKNCMGRGTIEHINQIVRDIGYSDYVVMKTIAQNSEAWRSASNREGTGDSKKSQELMNHKVSFYFILDVIEVNNFSIMQRNLIFEYRSMHNKSKFLI